MDRRIKDLDGDSTALDRIAKSRISKIVCPVSHRAFGSPRPALSARVLTRTPVAHLQGSQSRGAGKTRAIGGKIEAT
jgi:hypothetical protein